MAKRQNKVTVLMTVYNGECYLKQSVESILGQTFDDFEFLIINDGSTDHTRERILGYRDARIRLVQNDGNLGQTRSLNRGLRLATGVFLARQDIDDISEPQRLAKQVAFMESHPEVALVGTWYKQIEHDGTITAERTLPCYNTDIRWCLLFFCPFVHSSVMFRRSTVLAEVGLYNEAYSYSQDYELWRRIAQRFEVANLPEYLVRVRTHPDSMTATYGERAQEGHNLRVAQIEDLLEWHKGARSAASGDRFRAISSLLFGSETDFAFEAAKDAVREILRLQTAFSLDNAMEQKERRTHRTRISSRLRRRLFDNAMAAVRRGEYVVAGKFILEGLRLQASGSARAPICGAELATGDKVR